MFGARQWSTGNITRTSTEMDTSNQTKPNSILFNQRGCWASCFGNMSIKSLPLSYFHLRIRCSLISWKEHTGFQAMSHNIISGRRRRQWSQTTNTRLLMAGFISPQGVDFLCGVTCKHSCIVTCVTCVQKECCRICPPPKLLDEPHMDKWTFAEGLISGNRPLACFPLLSH